MQNLYLPFYNIDQFSCYSVVDKDTIRAYIEMPRSNSTSNYVDFYINSHYLEKLGTQQFTQYSVLPTCLDKNTITNDFYYRNDFPQICVLFLIFVIFGVYLPFKIFSNIFKGALK